MPTIQLTIAVAREYHDVLTSALLDLGAEAFEEQGEALAAFAPAEAWDPLAREKLRRWMEERGIQGTIRTRLIEDENWNERWEQSIEPLAVGLFLIRPSWCEAPASHDARYVLQIDPKMSFGTGYHESTRLLLRLIPDLVHEGDHVLDAGTGTGILSLAAVRCGAERVVAFDTDAWAVANAMENVKLNEASHRITVLHGDLRVVPEEPFDLILANINRNVILSNLPGYVARLQPGGRVALSGLLVKDAAVIRRMARVMELSEVREVSEGAWWGGVWMSAKRRDGERERA